MVWYTSTVAASLGGSEAQADWFDPKVGGHLMLVLHLSDELTDFH